MSTVELLQFVAVLIFVIGLIMGLSYIIRRYSMPGYGPFRKHSDRRLHVMESLSLDPKRRAIILKCDQESYLLVLGGQQDLVIDKLAPISITEDNSPKEPVLQADFSKKSFLHKDR